MEIMCLLSLSAYGNFLIERILELPYKLQQGRTDGSPHPVSRVRFSWMSLSVKHGPNSATLCCASGQVSLALCCRTLKAFLPGVSWFVEVTYSLLNVRNSAGQNTNIFFNQAQRIWTIHKSHTAKLQSYGFQILPDFSLVNISSTIWKSGRCWPAWLSYQRNLLLSCNVKSESAWQFNSKGHFF